MHDNWLMDALKRYGKPTIFYGGLFTGIGVLFLTFAPPLGVVMICAGGAMFILFAVMACCFDEKKVNTSAGRGL